MGIKLFYNGEWFAFVAPEYIDDMYHVENRLNEKAYAEAKANALEVGNPIILQTLSSANLSKNKMYECKQHPL